MVTGNQASLATWLCSALALAIILTRVVVVPFYRNRFDAGDWLSILSICVAVGRVANDVYLLRDGTANDALMRHLHHLTSAQLASIKTGSILALIARLFDTSFFWLQVAVLLLFYTKLLRSYHWTQIAIKLCWGFLITSYLVVVIVTFTECHPFQRYWQVTPDPGSCARAYIQLFLQGLCNIILDLIILGISTPLLRLKGRATGEKLRITIMVCLGLFCIIINCIRIPLVIQGKSAQPSRTFFASIQLLASAFVANAPTIYGRVRTGRRKRREQEARRQSVPETFCSSGETRSNSVDVSRQQSPQEDEKV